MIGVLAYHLAPELFGALVMIGPSPRYVDDGDYIGGFSRTDIAGLLDALDANHLGWSAQMAPVIMGNAERPELAEELTNSFCRTDPDIARQFARVTFLSDNRADLAGIAVPTLVLQCSDDVIAPGAVGDYVHEHVPGSVLTHLTASGHCPNLSAPEETTSAIRAFLSG
jgi:sigma-B regulation protein RsbQ